MLPATKAIPKEMLPIVDKPAIQYIVEEAFSSGIEDVLIITSHGKNALEEHFDRKPLLEQALTRSGKDELLGKNFSHRNWETFILYDNMSKRD